MKKLLSSKKGKKKGVREALTDPTVTVWKGRQLCLAPRNVQTAEWQQRSLQFREFSCVGGFPGPLRCWASSDTLCVTGIISEPSWHCAKLSLGFFGGCLCESCGLCCAALTPENRIWHKNEDSFTINESKKVLGEKNNWQ